MNNSAMASNSQFAKFIIGLMAVLLTGCANETQPEQTAKNTASEMSEKPEAQPISTLGFDDFQGVGCELDRTVPQQISVTIKPGSPCTLILQSPKLGKLPEQAWLSYVAEVDGYESPTANLMFWSEGNKGNNPDLISASGLFPGLKGRMSFPLKVLAEGRGAPKTPGTLIQFSFGKSVAIEEWSRLGLALMKISGPPATVVLQDFKFTQEQPSYPVPDEKKIDAMGQWIQKDWKDKVQSTDALDSMLEEEAAKPVPERDPERYSKYGGTKEKKFAASGYFRTHHDGKRWWLVDPEGYGFYSIGIDIIGPGISGNVDGIEKLHDWVPSKRGKYADAWEQQTMYDIQSPQGKEVDLLNLHVANLIRAFGKDWHEKWTEITKRRLIEWNVNSVGNWSDQEFARKAKIPYVIPLDDFPVTKLRIFRDFPDVFSREYEEKSAQFAKQLEKLKDDKYLIGYFMNNEPGWAYVPTINLAETLLEKKEDFVTKRKLIEFLVKRYHADIDEFNTAWNTSFSDFAELNKPLKKAAALSDAANADLTEFSKRMLDRYVEVPVKATRAVDPNHLNMGMRWASGALKQEWRFAGTQYLDVFSMNNYTDNPAPTLDLAAKMTGKPVLIGEFHHGSMEAGHSAFGARWTKTEKERAMAYRYYAEKAAYHTSSIGIHYFSYNDDPVLGRFDGQNFHQGFVSVTHTPYSDFVKGYAEVNDELYDVVQHKRKPHKKYADGMIMEIPMKF